MRVQPDTQRRRRAAASRKYRKRYGQHFLRHRPTLEAIAELAAAGGEATVLEIGAGEGMLTVELAGRAQTVLAVEVDQRLVHLARRNLMLRPNVRLLCADILRLDFSRLPRGLAAVGNLPYSISTPLVFRFIEHLDHFASMTFLLQREVAQRMIAEPGTKAYSVLSVAVQIHCGVEELLQIPRAVFSPPPKVDSSLVRLAPLEQPRIAPAEQTQCLRVVRAAFAVRRKTLRNALRQSGWIDLDDAALAALLESLGIDSERRGETLSIGEFAALSRALPQPRSAQ